VTAADWAGGVMADKDSRRFKLTRRLAKILKVFLEDPHQERYGLELMKLTGLASGSLYPALYKLEAAGLLTAGKEDIDPKIVGRPARRWYRINGDAVPAARDLLNGEDNR
jgi:PadR family transcriptional regulator, regulatory protein PadR